MGFSSHYKAAFQAPISYIYFVLYFFNICFILRLLPATSNNNRIAAIIVVVVVIVIVSTAVDSCVIK